jgi:hypothetical protein
MRGRSIDDDPTSIDEKKPAGGGGTRSIASHPATPPPAGPVASALAALTLPNGPATYVMDFPSSEPSYPDKATSNSKTATSFRPGSPSDGDARCSQMPVVGAASPLGADDPAIPRSLPSSPHAGHRRSGRTPDSATWELEAHLSSEFDQHRAPKAAVPAVLDLGLPRIMVSARCSSNAPMRACQRPSCHMDRNREIYSGATA